MADQTLKMDEILNSNGSGFMSDQEMLEFLNRSDVVKGPKSQAVLNDLRSKSAMSDIERALAESTQKAISPNDGSGDFNAFVNKMEGNPNEVPLEVQQSASDAALLAAYIKTQGSVSQELGQRFELIRDGDTLSGPEREAFTEILRSINPEELELILQGGTGFPDQSQVGSPRGDYEMNEGE